MAGMSFRDFLDRHGEAVGFLPHECRHPFGLLIKFLDANDVLSVQVHPDAETCERMGRGEHKTECWYVIAAEPGAHIYKGIKKGTTREQFAAAMAFIAQTFDARSADGVNAGLEERTTEGADQRDQRYENDC